MSASNLPCPLPVMPPNELVALREAKRLLENPGLASRLATLLGKPIELGFERLPASVRAAVGKATTAALKGALRLSMSTIGSAGRAASTPQADQADVPKAASQAPKAHPRSHKLAATLVGGVGGFFGGPALFVELPVSTCIMLRAIADIARSHGEDLAQPEARMACLEVFALGGVSAKDDGAESGYFAVRMALAKSAAEAAQYLASQAAADQAAPVLLSFIARVAARFQVQVSQKAVAAAVPVVGAALGGAVNLAFTDHFQDMAQGHFAVRRLERSYGKAAVRALYEGM